MRRRLVVVVVLALVCGACARDAPEANDAALSPSAFSTPFADDAVYPVLASSEISTGRNRFLVGLLDENDAPVGSPAVDMRVAFYDLERSTTEPVTETDMGWVWITKPYLGLYAGEVSFDRPGRWGAAVSVSGRGLDSTVRTSFEVRPESSTPEPGERVPASKTPTATTRAEIDAISTDPRPDPSFYDISIAEAVRAGEPFVAIFATPKFCVSQTCGPILDAVKSAARGFEDITFIHVEPYELPADPAALKPVPAALEWGLPSEPWVFVVDGRGRLAAKYEGALGVRELEAELRRLR